MSELTLTLACGPYDRTQALRDGSVKPDGINLLYVAGQPAELFWRMLQFKEFEVSEMSMSNYISLVGAGDTSFIAIPAFLSRVFRHGYIFINSNAGIEKPSDLVGKRCGVPEYSQTAAVMARGVLQHEYGVLPSQMEWVQGRADRMKLDLPADIRIKAAPAGQELSDMLERGDIDCLVTGNNPASFRRGAPTVKRLLRHPWVALTLYRAFCAAKERCYKLLMETGSPKATFGWLQAMIEQEQAVFGVDWYPYGVEKNQASLEALLQYNYEQGLTPRRIQIDELFAPSTMREIPLGEGQFT